MENKVDYDYYIGPVYTEDLYAYTHMKAKKHDEYAKPWQVETGIVRALRIHKTGLTAFCWPAALLGGLWYTYRGMVREAVVFDVFSMLFGGILIRFSFKASVVFFVILAIARGFAAVPLYYIKIQEAVEQRGLLMRSATESPAARKSLEEEGKPSVWRVLLYVFLKCFAGICLDSILFSVFAVIDWIS